LIRFGGLSARRFALLGSAPVKPGTVCYAIVHYARQGLPRKLIAEKVGTTPGTVKTVLHRARRLGMFQDRTLRAVSLPVAAYERLNREAAAREMHGGELAAHILKLVLTDDLLAAVLDE
jgi:hypothetical protein